MARVDGKTVKVGDCIGFKSDTEQDGIITKVNGNMLTLKPVHDSGFHGDYIGGRMSHIVDAGRCWLND
jgi:hypothetical protein